MDLRLNGKTAIVTGASRGIGLAITRTANVTGANITIDGGLIPTM
jgi:NAD(P)-dependent dehydrogenase (short-subunit alcohol dehydrogenase family)